MARVSAILGVVLFLAASGCTGKAMAAEIPLPEGALHTERQGACGAQPHGCPLGLGGYGIVMAVYAAEANATSLENELIAKLDAAGWTLVDRGNDAVDATKGKLSLSCTIETRQAEVVVRCLVDRA